MNRDHEIKRSDKKLNGLQTKLKKLNNLDVLITIFFFNKLIVYGPIRRPKIHNPQNKPHLIIKWKDEIFTTQTLLEMYA